MGRGTDCRIAALAAVALTAGCGRVGFDALAGSAGDDGGGMEDAGAPEDGGVPGDGGVTERDPALGDLLHYTFEERVLQVLFDRSGNRLDPGLFVQRTDGKYGEGGDFGGGLLFVPKDPLLLERDQLTFEAWLMPDGQNEQEWLLSDFEAISRSSPPTYHFGLVPEGVEVVTGPPCGSEQPREVLSTGTQVPAGVWSHLAVTWDGQDVRFYLNGELTETLAMSGGPPCTADNFFLTVGGVFRAEVDYLGLLDELKLSSYAKSAEEIQVSMTTPTGASRCGDGVVQAGEACEGPDLCCDAALCETAADGTACGEGTCDQGVCASQAGPVESGLIALYELEEGTGSTVGDSSGAGAPADLTITSPGAVTWVSGGLQINQSTVIGSAGPAQEIMDAVAASGAVTVEAWVEPSSLAQNGPARIATVAVDPLTGNLLLGQELGRYYARFQSAGTYGPTARPGLGSPDGDVREQLTHLVFTRSADGERRLYVDGRLRSRSRVPGPASNWDPDAELALANDPGGERPWLGTLYRVALYDRALSAFEVARNFSAGAGPL